MLLGVGGGVRGMELVPLRSPTMAKHRDEQDDDEDCRMHLQFLLPE